MKRDARVNIRPATPDDAAVIAHVHVESWRSTYAGIVSAEYLSALDQNARAEQWLTWLALPVATFVAESDGEVVGFISGGTIREPLGDYDAELFAAYLLEPARRRRIGTALLYELATALMRKGFSSMMVWVLEENPARQFYKKAGAELLTSKKIEIGGQWFEEAAYGWADLSAITKAQWSRGSSSSVGPSSR